MNIDINGQYFCSRIKQAIEAIYPQSRGVHVAINKIRFEKTTSKPYGKDGELIADFIDRMSVDIKIDVDCLQQKCDCHPHDIAYYGHRCVKEK